MVFRLCDLCGGEMPTDRPVAALVVPTPFDPLRQPTTQRELMALINGESSERYDICADCARGLLDFRAVVMKTRRDTVPQRS